jgi:hypothetical protein
MQEGNNPTTILSLVAGGIGLSFTIKSAARTKPDTVVLRDFEDLRLMNGGKRGASHYICGGTRLLVYAWNAPFYRSPFDYASLEATLRSPFESVASGRAIRN